jgi:hypothetical protein
MAKHAPLNSREVPETYEPQYLPDSYIGEDQQDFTKWRFDVAEMLRELEHELLGESKAYDKDGVEKWVKKGDVSATMTYSGAREVVSMCRMAVNKVTMLSGLEKNEIRLITREFNLALVDILFDNWKAWEVDKGKLDMIVVKTTRLVFIALKHAQDSNTLNSLTKVEQIKRVITGGDKKDDGLRLNPFGGGNKND